MQLANLMQSNLTRSAYNSITEYKLTAINLPDFCRRERKKRNISESVKMEILRDVSISFCSGKDVNIAAPAEIFYYRTRHKVTYYNVTLENGS